MPSNVRFLDNVDIAFALRMSAFEPKTDIRRGTALALLLAAVTLGLVGLFLIAANATAREHRRW